MDTPEKQIDGSRPEPVKAVEIWWSRAHGCYLATAPAAPGIVMTGATFSEAAIALEKFLLAGAPQAECPPTPLEPSAQ
jgi:hypothetical protein